MFTVENLLHLPVTRPQKEDVLARLGLVRSYLPPRLAPDHRNLVAVAAGVRELDPVVSDLRTPEVVAVVVEAGVDLELRVRGLEVACEWLEICEHLLQISPKQKTSNLHSDVCDQTGIGWPGVQMRIVMTCN